MSKRLGILGGAFDPIHYGHLLLAAEARQQLELDQVIFVPTAQSAHQQKDIATPFLHRYKMTELALAAYPEFVASDIEEKLGGTSYTVKTLTALAQLHPDASLFFLLGADNFEQLDTWFEPEKLPELATLAVVARTGSKLPKTLPEQALEVRMPRIDISASEIRERVGQGRSIRVLVSHEVESYIESERLYRG